MLRKSLEDKFHIGLLLDAIVLGILFVLPLQILVEVPAFADVSIDPTSFLTVDIANALVSSVAIGMNHRPYEPATALGSSIGLALGAEATLVQPPANLSSALSGIASLGGGGSSPVTVPALPSARLHMSKGVGSRVDFGISFLPTVSFIPIIGGSYYIGGDIKAVVYSPEEGLTWAVRGMLNSNSVTALIAGQKASVDTTTIGFQVLVSRKMSLADPYLGVGLQYGMGYIKVQNPLSAFFGPSDLTQMGHAYGAEIFGGVDFKIPSVGFRITLEGGYSPFGMNYMGTKIGFGF